MAYRLQRRDPRALHVLRDATSDDLPEEAALALKEIDDELAAVSPARVTSDDERVTFYRDPLEREALGELTRRAVALWLLVQIPFAMLSTRYVGAGLALWAFVSVTSAVLLGRPLYAAAQRNHRRSQGRITDGVFLLPDAVVIRKPDGMHYLPRERVQEVLISRLAAVERGKESKPARSEVTLSYRDERGRARGLSISSLPFPGHDPEVARGLQAWLSGESPEEMDHFGDASPADLARRDWAQAWRRFWRLRGAAQIAATCGTLFTGAWVFIAGRFRFAFLVVVLTWIAAAVLRWRYKRFRCPRCGLSPRQPLRSRETRRCLTCGLPIFTAAKSAPRLLDEEE